jgi:hypothetical protein
MPNSPRAEFNEVDISHGIADIPKGIIGVQVKTKRGPIARPDLVITSWPQFERIYGGLIVGEQGPTLAKRALDRGSALRVLRSMHYTDLTNPGSYAANFSLQAPSYKVILSGALAAGHSITVTKGAEVVTQAFSVSGINTLNLLAAQLRLMTWVGDVKVIDATHFYIGATSAVATATLGAGAPVVSSQTPYTSVVDAAGNALFDLIPKNPGADPNNLVVYVDPASNARADSFNLKFVHKLEPALNEEYQNLRIIGKPTGVSVVPDKGLVFAFQGGSEGAAITAADYIGDSVGKTGFQGFNGIDDVSAVAVLDNIEALNGVHEAGSAYAESRKDLKYYGHIPGTTEAAVVAARAALNIDSSYTRFFTGGVRHINTLTNLEEVVSELGDVIGIASYSEEKFGPYKAFSGKTRGEVFNAIGAGNQWGARGNYVNLNLLAQAQVNPVITRDNKTYLLSNFTAQVQQSQLSWGNVRDLTIWVKKSLFPTVEKYLDEPCHPDSWKNMYLEVKPWLDALQPLRAIHEYRWEGDQFAKSVLQQDLFTNNAADVAQGKYKARLWLKPVVSMVWIGIDVILVNSSVSFEDVIEIQQPL